MVAVFCEKDRTLLDRCYPRLALEMPPTLTRAAKRDILSQIYSFFAKYLHICKNCSNFAVAKLVTN